MGLRDCRHVSRELIKIFCEWEKDPPPIPDPNGVSGGDGSGAMGYMTDPNRKLGPAGYGTSGYIPKNQLMNYTIEFENMDEATAPAHIIRVIDELDEGLDLDTFELVEVVFANHSISIPPGLQKSKTNYLLPVDNEYILDSEVMVQVDISLREPLTI